MLKLDKEAIKECATKNVIIVMYDKKRPTHKRVRVHSSKCRNLVNEGIVVAAPLETRHYWRYDLNENLTPKYNDDIQIQYVSKCCVNKIDKKYLEKHGLKLFSKKYIANAS